MEIEKKQTQRFQILNLLYEMSDGNENSSVMIDKLKMNSKFDDDIFWTTLAYLDGEGLAILDKYTRKIISITHKGVKEIEDAYIHKDKATEHFPPINKIGTVNIINVHDANHTQIQQGNTNSTQNNEIINNKILLIEIVKRVREEILKSSQYDDPTKSHIEAEVKTIESQLSSPKPKLQIIKDCLNTIASYAIPLSIASDIKGFIAMG